MGFDVEQARTFGATMDFGRTTGDYRRYRPGFPPAFFDTLQARGWLRAGMDAVDLATGTGAVARGLARAGDADDLARVIEWLASHPSGRAAMGAAGRARVEKDWNYEAQFQPVLDLLETKARGARER